MERNAFARFFPVGSKHQPSLHPGPQRKRPRLVTSTALAPTPQGSHFVECPLCTKSFHSSLVQSHVNECLGFEDKATVRPSQPPEITNIGPNQTSYSSMDSSGATGSPNCGLGRGRGNYSNLMTGSSQGCEGIVSRPAKSDNGGPIQVYDSVRGLHSINSSNRSVHSTHNIGNNGISPSPVPAISSQSDTSQDPLASAENAFSRMMAASALSDFREEMYLWAHDDGTLSWGWGAAGSPCPAPPKASPMQTTSTLLSSEGSYCGDVRGRYTPRQQEVRRWSCQVATKGPNGFKAGTCELWTNLPSATEAVLKCVGVSAAEGGVVNGPRSAAGGNSNANAGVRAALPGRSLSRLPVPVVKSMLQKNVRRGNAEAAARCALELALKSWNDAIRRVLVIIMEDSLLHPAAPLLSWLMVATSKGYRPPPRLVDAFLCVVHETALCSVRDTVDSCQIFDANNGHPAAVSLAGADFPCPHPRDLIPSNGDRNPRGTDRALGEHSAIGQHLPGRAAFQSPGRRIRKDGSVRAEVFSWCYSDTEERVGDIEGLIACCRRALLFRTSYGGMACDQALLKGSCLAWGERCHGHLATKLAVPEKNNRKNQHTCAQNVPAPHIPPVVCIGKPVGAIPPFDYIHRSVLLALQEDPWMKFVLSAHEGGGMPNALRSTLLTYIAIGENETTVSSGYEAEHSDERNARPPETSEKLSVVEKPATNEPERKFDRMRVSSTGAEGSVAAAGAQPIGIGGPILREVDATLSGVDFHCSKVLEDILRSTAMAERVRAAIRAATAAAGGSTSDSSRGPTSNFEPTTEDLMRAAKRAMWACSSGVNVRKLRLMFTIHGDHRGGEIGAGRKGAMSSQVALLSPVENGIASGVDERVWEAISTDVLRWARKYVKGRLVTPEESTVVSAGGL